MFFIGFLVLSWAADLTFRWFSGSSLQFPLASFQDGGFDWLAIFLNRCRVLVAFLSNDVVADRRSFYGYAGVLSCSLSDLCHFPCDFLYIPPPDFVPS